MFKKDIGLNLVILFHFICTPLIIWFAYEAKLSGMDTEVIVLGGCAVLMLLIGDGRLERINIARVTARIITWFNVIIVGLQTFIGIPLILFSSEMELDLSEAIITIISFLISALIVRTLQSEGVKIQFTPNKEIKNDI